MKRVIALVLAFVLLFSACGAAKPVPGGPEKLTADKILFYPPEGLKDRQGALLPLKEVEAAWTETLFPRSHSYDELFPGDGERLLHVLDYCFANGYAGFSVPSGTLALDLSAQQFRALRFVYRIDDSKVLAHRGDGDGAYDTVRLEYREGHQEDTMPYFVLGLEAVREIVKEAPKDLNDYETACWVMDYLHAHVQYGDRDRYYYTDGHQLYDALVGGTTLCSGYADAMYYLCNALGVDCLCVYGLCISQTKDGGLDDHLWNLVRMDGDWYYCDPTWNATAGPTPVPRFFGLSEQALYLLNGDRRTGEYNDDTMIPASVQSYDPTAHWNDTPEGALKSWLWFAGYAAQEPVYLIAALDLVTEDVQLEAPDAEGYLLSSISYADFSGKIAQFMTEDCFAAWFAKAYREKDGKLSLWQDRTGDPVWELQSLREAGDAWNAVLLSSEGEQGEAALRFEVLDGRYRVESFEWLP